MQIVTERSRYGGIECKRLKCTNSALSTISHSYESEWKARFVVLIVFENAPASTLPRALDFPRLDAWG